MRQGASIDQANAIEWRARAAAWRALGRASAQRIAREVPEAAARVAIEIAGGQAARGRAVVSRGRRLDRQRQRLLAEGAVRVGHEVVIEQASRARGVVIVA